MSNRITASILLIALTLTVGCASFSSNKTTIYASSTGAELTSGGTVEIKGWEGQVLVKNIGPGSITVSAENPSGVKFFETNLKSRTDCLVTTSSDDRIKIVNSSDDYAEVKFERLGN